MNRLTSNTPLTEFEAMNMSITNLYARLKEYENTGLEPKEIGNLLCEAISLKKELDEYTTAKREGRLPILPCKVGDSAWFIAAKQVVMYGRCRNISIHSGGIQIAMYDTDGEPWNVSYKRVFPTREEAEAALRGGADG